MPIHRLAVVREVDVWQERHCTCSTGDTCDCGPCGYWDREQRVDELRLWFDYGEPCPGWRPTYSRGYSVPDKVPRRRREAPPVEGGVPQRGGRPGSSLGLAGRAGPPF